MPDYKKYFIISAAPELVYKALTTKITIQLWTADKAEMEPVAGSEFSLWDGSITGKNIEFEDGKKIVQQWYFGNKEASIVTIKLHKHKQGTSVELRHTNIPDDAFKEITQGWEDSYFGALADFYHGEN